MKTMNRKDYDTKVNSMWGILYAGCGNKGWANHV